ncbi:MAG TPA: hypothetical protein VF418_03125 [Sphingomonadaceae bacterium]
MTGYGFRKLLAALLAVWAACLLASPAAAASCYYASSQGTTGPADWQTYCWLDLSGYNNTAATSAAGQSFNYTLPDGTTMSFTLKVTTANALTSSATPSWTGAAVGNTAFLGISGKPILYQTGSGGSSTVTISNITLTPPASGTITNYMFVAADGESTNGGESLKFQTNGGTWQMLDQVGPINGSTYPAIGGTGTATFTETGVDGNVGAYIVGSTTPTTVTTTMVGSGLEGAMFAVRFASIRLTTQIATARADADDQFAFTINATGTGSLLASGTSSGTGLGPFTAAALSSSAAIPLTLNQAMAGGSANAIAHYRSVLKCTNSTSSSTPLPNNVVTTSYNFGSLQFGDAVQCTYTETPYPHLTLVKVLTGGGRFSSARAFPNDQFILNIDQGTTVVATTTTTGSNSTLNNASTPQYQATAGTAYTFVELGAGSTSIDQYTATMSCDNDWAGSSTNLPTAPGGSVTPQLGDVITCTITNKKRSTNGTLSLTKVSIPVSDPINGTINPLMIPGAIVKYTIYVQNSGSDDIDQDTIFIADALPSQISVGTASSPAFADGSPSSGLSWTQNTTYGIRYSNSATAPTGWTSCTYNPSSSYDPAVKYVCLKPKGTMNGRSTNGAPTNFSVSFQALVK